MKKVLRKISKNQKEEQYHKSNEDAESIKSVDVTSNKSKMFHFFKNSPKENSITDSIKSDDIEKSPNLPIQKLSENKDSTSDILEMPKDNISTKISTFVKSSDFYKFAKLKISKSISKNPEYKNRKSKKTQPSSERTSSIEDKKPDIADVHPRSSSNLDGEMPIRDPPGTRTSNASAPFNETNIEIPSTNSSNINEEAPSLSYQNELVEQLDIRLKDLEERFDEFTTLVQAEFENVQNSINSLKDFVEMVQYKTNDRLNEFDDGLNICVNKTQYVENQQLHQQAVLNVFDSYFGDLDRKWGSPVLRSVIPVLVFLLITARAMWNYLGHKHIIIPIAIVIGLWILKKLIFG